MTVGSMLILWNAIYLYTICLTKSSIKVFFGKDDAIILFFAPLLSFKSSIVLFCTPRLYYLLYYALSFFKLYNCGELVLLSVIMVVNFIPVPEVLINTRTADGVN